MVMYHDKVIISRVKTWFNCWGGGAKKQSQSHIFLFYSPSNSYINRKPKMGSHMYNHLQHAKKKAFDKIYFFIRHPQNN